MITLNKAHYPVTALGPGRRIGLWLQGCALSCPGYVSRDTWAFAEDRSLPLPALLSWCQDVASLGLDGVTISGGEPFAQPEALLALLEAIIPEPFKAQWRVREWSAIDVASAAVAGGKRVGAAGQGFCGEGES